MQQFGMIANERCSLLLEVQPSRATLQPYKKRWENGRAGFEVFRAPSRPEDSTGEYHENCGAETFRTDTDKVTLVSRILRRGARLFESSARFLACVLQKHFDHNSFSPDETENPFSEFLRIHQGSFLEASAEECKTK